MRFARSTVAAILFLSLGLFVGRLYAVGNAASPPAEAQDRYAPLKRFSQILNLVEDNYVQDISRHELVEDAIKGMLQQLDPHSMYMSAEEFQEMQVSTSGEFTGIGIEISQENGRLIVVTPIEDTPADKAGLKSGDLILEIEGESTQDITLFEAVQKIRGPKGEPVVLTILHKGATTPEEVTIVRGVIPIYSVKSEKLEDGVMYIRLTRFHENTTEELHDALNKFRKENGKIKGIVLDLRNNPGGILQQAVSVSDTFIKEGLIVYIQGRDKATRKDFNATSRSGDVNVPMVTLVNAGSASAAEIVAGALQDHKRSLLVGERSFGKGSVQTVVPLSDGAGIKLTTALYYTPKGRSIQAEGIVPDINIPFEPVREGEEKDKRFIFREQDLSRHLENHKSPKAETGKATEKVLKMLARDNQLRLALQLVKQLPKIKDIQ